jgi:hypothetical protein
LAVAALFIIIVYHEYGINAPILPVVRMASGGNRKQRK